MQSFDSLIRLTGVIHNKECPSRSKESLKVVNKYSGRELAKIAMIDDEQMEEAILSSCKGFEVLRSMNTGERRALLQNLYRLLEENSEAMAAMIVAEAGKPLVYARAEVERSLSTLEQAIEQVRHFGGESIPMDFGAGVGKSAFTKRFPKGVVACISPFNFPLNLAMHKIAPALAVGCSVLLKPSPYTPLSTLALAGLAVEAGFPPGSLNVFVASNETTQKMVEDERIAHFSFTGSPSVGWMLKNICGKKSVTLELGGNAAVIVDETSDLSSVAGQVATGAFLYSGQICISTQRILVAESVYPEFRNLLVKEVEKIKVGDPLNEENMVGPLIDSVHLARIDEWVKEAVEEGAEILCGGQIESSENHLYSPTLLEKVTKDMRVWCDEVFGPVAVLSTFKNFEQAVEEVNASTFGLQAGVFTKDIERMKYAFSHLEVGGVIINNVPGFRIDHMPYGGVKDSGFGREGTRYAMEEFTEAKLLVF